jgi:hypothetical protein
MNLCLALKSGHEKKIPEMTNDYSVPADLDRIRIT